VTSVLPFFYMMNLVLLTRLFYQFRDSPIRKKDLPVKTLIEFAGFLLLHWNGWLLASAVGILILNILAYRIEKREEQINLKRLLILAGYFLLFGLFFAPGFQIAFNDRLISFVVQLSSYHLLIEGLQKIHWISFHIVLWGFLLSLNEANIFIRYFFEVLQLAPLTRKSKMKAEIDMKEYNRGRVIGFLERALIYFFMISGQYAAIGFILTAKGITRFKELDRRDFAEYFLIGTLLSAILAGAIALLVKILLPS